MINAELLHAAQNRYYKDCAHNAKDNTVVALASSIKASQKYVTALGFRIPAAWLGCLCKPTWLALASPTWQ